MTALYDFTYTPGDDDDPDMLGALVNAYASKRGLARALGVEWKSVNYWLGGGRPQRHNLERIAELYEHLIAWETAA